MATKQTTAASAKPKALSLHLGLNAVSGAAYGGWTGPLAACEFDANDMAAIATSKGMKPTLLLTKKATRANMLAGTAEMRHRWQQFVIGPDPPHRRDAYPSPGHARHPSKSWMRRT